MTEDPQPTPTHRQLGEALRVAAKAARNLGESNRWSAAAGSGAAATWKAAVTTEDPLQVTLADADLRALLLARSAFAHAGQAGRAIARQQPFLPHSVGRIAFEHSLLVLHLIDQDVTPIERAERRLDDVLYALSEKTKQRDEFIKKAGLDAGEDEGLTAMVDDVTARATTLGFTVKTHRSFKHLRFVSERGRPSTMSLAETYLPGVRSGFGEWLMRGHGASIHGLETSFLEASTAWFDSDVGVYLPIPQLPDPSVLASTLVGVPVALTRSVHALANRFDWPQDKAWDNWVQSEDQLMDTWLDTVASARTTPAAPATGCPAAAAASAPQPG